MSTRYWQEREGGELVKATSSRHKWYGRVHWANLRTFVLARDPLCTICHRAASHIADHIRPWITAEGIVSWALFADPLNLRGLCDRCHSRITVLYDRGFGHAVRAGKTDHLRATGETGRQFISSTVGSAALDKALEGMDELLGVRKADTTT